MNLFEKKCLYGLIFLITYFHGYPQEAYQLPEKLQKIMFFEDEFNNNSNKWKLSSLYPLYTQIEHGRLTMHAEDYESKIEKKIRFSLKNDFEIEFSMRWFSGDSIKSAGFVYGSSGHKYYKIGLHPLSQEFVIEKVVFDKSDVIAKKRFDGYYDEFFNKVNIRVVKKKLYVFVNEKLVYSGKSLKLYDKNFGFYLPGNSTYAIDYIRFYNITKVKIKKNP